MPSQYRVAVVGCGAICGNHIKSLLNAGQQICALCDILPEHAHIAAEKYGLENVAIYTDYATMLSDCAPDAVHICTPHYLHTEMCIAALEKNIHVLCEKPIAITQEQLEVLRRAVQASDAQLGVCHQNRYEPNMIRLRELAAEGVRGGCGMVAWKRNKAYYESGEWRGKWETEGGGVMINQALHTLDLMQWVCGMPTHVTAHISNDSLRGVIEVEDTATARFECADGTVLHFFATVAAGTDFPVLLRVRLASGKVVEAENNLLTLDNALAPAPEHGEQMGKSVWGDGHKRLIADFYNCLRENRPFPVGLDEAEKVIRLILAMYRSGGERVEI